MVLPAIGNGFFDDQNPTVYAVGTNPSSLFVGNFTGALGQEIATVNSGSNTVSLVSNLGSASPVTQSVSSGGTDPAAAFMVPGTGAASLVVANSGNGSISLFEGGENGLSLNSVLSTAGLPNPSALALASFGTSGLEFWATNDGEQSASLLGFQLQESTAETSAAVSSSATLLSLNESSLALVGTLLTVTLDLQSETVESSEGTAALVAAASSGSAGQSLTGMFRSPEEEFEEFAEIAAAPGARAPAAAAWARYVSGLDQAIERVGREADEQLFQEQQPAKAAAPGTSLLEEDDAAGQAGTATFVEEAALEAGRRVKAERDRLEAIDNSLGNWTKESPRALRRSCPSHRPAPSPDPSRRSHRTRRATASAHRQSCLGQANSTIAACFALLIKTIVRSSRMSVFREWSPSRRSRRRHSWPGKACCADRSPWPPALLPHGKSGLAESDPASRQPGKPRMTAGTNGNECPQRS